MKKLESAEIAEFVAKLNKEEENYTGFVGTEEEEILHYLINEFESLDSSFCVEKEADGIKAIIGAEIFNDKTGEVWGPFIADEGENKFLEFLWNDFIEKIPKDTESLSFYFSKVNKKSEKLCKAIKASRKKEHYILIAKKESFKACADNEYIDTLNEQDYIEFADLHDKIFPKTYYSGRQIVERISEENVVFVFKQKRVRGYIYIEASKEFDEASIEFLGVDSEFRNHGIGSQLLQHALKWVFQDKKISKAYLSVNSENANALSLYEAAGFELQHHMVNYLKEAPFELI